MIIETKYNVGDTVYAGKAEWGQTHVTCPVCAGTEKWTVTAANDSWEADCQTCYWTRFHHSGPDGTVKKSTRTAMVEQLTIGSVQLDTNGDEGHKYMCVETGVGSGRVYYEKSLFATREEAQSFAESEVDRQLPEAYTEDQRQQDWNRIENMHHCTRPKVEILTVRRDSRRWRAWIEGGPQAEESTKFRALEALAIKLATP